MNWKSFIFPFIKSVIIPFFLPILEEKAKEIIDEKSSPEIEDAITELKGKVAAALADEKVAKAILKVK